MRLLEAETRTGRRVRLRVRTRRTGTWQASVSEGAAEPVPPPLATFWVFVDLSAEPVAFYIARDEWVRRDIFDAHQAYLARHGGHRAKNDASDHHAVRLERLTGHRDAWDKLGLID